MSQAATRGDPRLLEGDDGGCGEPLLSAWPDIMAATIATRDANILGAALSPTLRV